MEVWRELWGYRRYVVRSAGALLRSEVADSYLGWAWWVLDPLLFMGVYTFVARVVFRAEVEHFPLFVFTGLGVWTFLEKTVLQSVNLLRVNRGIITRIRLPKQVLLLQRMAVNGAKFLITLGLVLALLPFARVPLSRRALLLLPYLLLLCLLTFAAGSWCLHLGAFVEDLQNASAVLLRLLFYLSGVFYDLFSMAPEPWGRWLLALNPVALVMQGCRGALLGRPLPDPRLLLLWGGVSLLFAWGGSRVIRRYENSYGKVI